MEELSNILSGDLGDDGIYALLEDSKSDDSDSKNLLFTDAQELIIAWSEEELPAAIEKIEELKATKNYSSFYKDLTGPRMEQLARMHNFFGANVFLAGPDVVPDEVALMDDIPEDFFFTVEKVSTTH